MSGFEEVGWARDIQKEAQREFKRRVQKTIDEYIESLHKYPSSIKLLKALKKKIRNIPID